MVFVRELVGHGYRQKNARRSRNAELRKRRAWQKFIEGNGRCYRAMTYRERIE